MIDSLGIVEHPAAVLADLRARASGACVLMSFDLAQYWLPGTPTIALHALCLAEGDNLLCVISDSGESLQRMQQDTGHIDRATLVRLADEIDATVIDLSRPLRLETVRIEKPWGAEIWYTGVEQRGVCRVGNTPLPWLVAMAGELLCGVASSHLVLLKILDPHPEPVYGDLYFEMHEQKVEVYVVTHVENSAWPEGTGAIRFGFDRDKLDEFVTLEGFKEAWLESVNAYRRVRREIDDAFDRFRELEGIGTDEVIPPDVAEQWKARLDAELNDRERQPVRKAQNGEVLCGFHVGEAG